jgi:large subunit ribosomal protein L30
MGKGPGDGDTFMAKLAVTWKKSAIGYAQDQKDTIRALGLHRLNQTVEHDDSRSIRGMINKVRHLVSFQELSE